MKIVNPTATVLDPAGRALYEFVELAGRTCYKSEANITSESALSFAKRLMQNKHMAMLEHGVVYVAVDQNWNIGNLLSMTNIRCGVHIDKYIHSCHNKMSGSLRTFAEMFDALFSTESVDIGYIPFEMGALCCLVARSFPDIFTDWRRYLDDMSELYGEDRIRECMDIFHVLSHDAFEDLCIQDKDTDALRICLCHTVKFTVDRGVTHELVRHRPCSFAQESTRYCNYSKGKYGSEITVVEPSYTLLDANMKNSPKYKAWLEGCKAAEAAYMAMLDAGASAQEARAVLPQSVKADIIVTANEDEWKHILNLRLLGTTGAPHPDMRCVMDIAAEALAEVSPRLNAYERCVMDIACVSNHR